MYIIYTVIQLPRIIYMFIKSDKLLIYDLFIFVRNFILVGSDAQLWYFVALIFATFFLFLGISTLKLTDKQIAVICIILYIVGVIGNAYINPLKELNGIGFLIEKYYQVFVTTRNGLFFGLPYVFSGYYIRKNAKLIKKRNFIIWGLLSFLAMNTEKLIAYKLCETTEHDMLFSLCQLQYVYFWQ